MEYQIIKDPPDGWLARLRRNHWVWLVKEQQIAGVEFPYEPPEPGARIGRIGIRRFSMSENRWLDIQSWYISLDGQGLDGSQLMLPLVGNLPENPEPLPDPIVRQFQRAMEDLTKRVETLEGVVLNSTPMDPWQPL
jgi:hypothetical protein